MQALGQEEEELVAEEKTDIVEQQQMNPFPQMVGEKQMQVVVVAVAAVPQYSMDQERQMQEVVAAAAELVVEKKDWKVQPNKREWLGEVVPKHRRREEPLLPREQQV